MTMLYLLIALQLADIATTHYALKSGAGTEGNPVLRKLFDRFGHEPSPPTSGGYIGWVCTVAGSPGTWKTFALIS